MYPSVEARLHGMQQRGIDACKNLPADHPLQPPMIEPIQFVHADAEGVDDHTGTYISNINVSSSQPISQTETFETYEPSIIPDLVNHYSGELPGYESNIEKASDIAPDEVMAESPHQQTLNHEMASSTDFIVIPDIHPEPVHHEQSVPELDVPEQVLSHQSNIVIEAETSINDQPSSSNLAIQPCASAKTILPSPPTLFLDSTILVCV